MSSDLLESVVFGCHITQYGDKPRPLMCAAEWLAVDSWNMSLSALFTMATN